MKYSHKVNELCSPHLPECIPNRETCVCHYNLHGFYPIYFPFKSLPLSICYACLSGFRPQISVATLLQIKYIIQLSIFKTQLVKILLEIILDCATRCRVETPHWGALSSIWWIDIACIVRHPTAVVCHKRDDTRAVFLTRLLCLTKWADIDRSILRLRVYFELSS